MCVCTHFNKLLHPFSYHDIKKWGVAQDLILHITVEKTGWQMCADREAKGVLVYVFVIAPNSGLCVCNTPMGRIINSKIYMQLLHLEGEASRAAHLSPVWMSSGYSLANVKHPFVSRGVFVCTLPLDEECAACCLVPLKEQRAQQHAVPAIWICSLILRGAPPMFIPQNLFSCDSCRALPLSLTSPFLALTCSLNMYSHMSQRFGCWNAALLFSPAVHSCDMKPI